MAKRTSIHIAACLMPLALAGCSSTGFTGSSSTQAPPNPAPATSTATPQTNPTPAPSPSPSTSSTHPPTPANAVTKGSFTVWAVPPDPQPLEDYQIYLTATLPSNVASYQESDLSGTVNGTDGYSQQLSQSVKHSGAGGVFNVTTLTTVPPQFTVNGNVAELVIWVPGASAHVNDTVNVRSALLNESQSIQIQFQ